MDPISTSIKLSVYEKRKKAAIPAPLELDSDSDFNAGEYAYENKGSRPKKAQNASTSGRKHRYRKDDISRRNLPHFKKRQGMEVNKKENPLLEFFDHDLDLHSASEEEDEGTDLNPFGVEDAHDNVEGPSDHDEEPVMLKTLANFVARSHSKSKKSGASDDSVTESDTEDDEPSVLFKRKISGSSQDVPPIKRQKITVLNDEESVTELDSDVEGRNFDKMKQTVAPPKPQHTLVTQSDSETESDMDPEVDLLPNPKYKPRPGFPLAPGQTSFGPLVLDPKESTMVPGAINTYLREYQRDGVKFFWDRYRHGRGGLLGDDMGLVSKTIQVISFLSAIMHKHGDKRDLYRRHNHVSMLQDGKNWKKHRILPPANATWPTCLIIAPSSVVYNWEREFETWAYFEIGMYVGKDRESVLNNFKLGRLDVVVTSFDTARRDIDVLDTLPWSLIIVDEVHRVKNVNAQITRSFHRFTCPRRFGLTGTTIQNSYLEMWTILDWTNPGRFGSIRQWKGFVVKPLTIGQSTGATEDERVKSLLVARILKEKVLPQFFLRRTKDVIKHQLPEKTDQVVFCPLTPTQITVYKRILATNAVQNLINRNERCSCGSREKRKNCCHPFEPGDIFRYMSILIKISNHLALILPSPGDTLEQTIRNRELAEIAFNGEPTPKYGTAMLQPQYCGKWGVLEMLLKDWHKDPLNKVLIFTKSVKLLEMLEFHLNTRNYGFLKLDGSTKQELRMPMIDQFHEDPHIFIFLISTLAGGTGLNLTGANKVVIFDPNWNPAHDLQAMDRAYRFGQTRDVFVYRLLGAGSVEELIYARQLYKQQQMAIGYQASVQTRYFQGVQGDTSKQGELFGLENIFRLHEDTLATKMAIEKANLAELDWALANLDPAKSKKLDNRIGETWIADAETKVAKEDGDFRGLVALLFDDDPPMVPPEDEITKTLNAIGVKYSHRNDDVLVPSRIEEERSRTAIKKRRKSAKRQPIGLDSPQRRKSPAPQWPPKRKHRELTPSPPQSETLELLKSHRQIALIALGFINSPAQLPAFAQSFTRKSREEQNEILARLDAFPRH